MTEHSKIYPMIQNFKEMRVASGLKFDYFEHHLNLLDVWYLEKHPGEDKLTRELVYEWLGEMSKFGCEQIAKCQTIRAFALYLCAMGQDAYVLPDKYIPTHSANPPYLFTDDELRRLFSEIDLLSSPTREPFLEEMMPTLFRLIYTCGLRPNEGRNLLLNNVHLSTGEILITPAKKKKERMVVMSDDMLKMANEYAQRRVFFAGDNPYFFPSVSGGPLTNAILYSALNKAWHKAAAGTSAKTNVRVYDLRHRFATACLTRWIDSGENLFAMLPYLRSYMGHATLNETAYYIHILPENISRSSAFDWERFNDLFPEVK